MKIQIQILFLLLIFNCDALPLNLFKGFCASLSSFRLNMFWSQKEESNNSYFPAPPRFVKPAKEFKKKNSDAETIAKSDSPVRYLGNCAWFFWKNWGWETRAQNQKGLEDVATRATQEINNKGLEHQSHLNRWQRIITGKFTKVNANIEIGKQQNEENTRLAQNTQKDIASLTEGHKTLQQTLETNTKKLSELSGLTKTIEQDFKKQAADHVTQYQELAKKIEESKQLTENMRKKREEDNLEICRKIWAAKMGIIHTKHAKICNKERLLILKEDELQKSVMQQKIKYARGFSPVMSHETTIAFKL